MYSAPFVSPEIVRLVAVPDSCVPQMNALLRLMNSVGAAVTSVPSPSSVVIVSVCGSGIPQTSAVVEYSGVPPSPTAAPLASMQNAWNAKRSAALASGIAHDSSIEPSPPVAVRLSGSGGGLVS